MSCGWSDRRVAICLDFGWTVTGQLSPLSRAGHSFVLLLGDALNPPNLLDYLFIYVFLLFPEVQKCYVFRHWVRLFVYLCICIIYRSLEMLCFLALCQIICLFMYFYYFQKSRNVMFSGTVPDYLFIYVFISFPEVQKCYVFWHCARLFVYLCISIISRSPEMLCFLALCQIICLFMYFYYFQKSRNFRFSDTARLFVYLCICIIYRRPEMLFSGTWSNY